MGDVPRNPAAGGTLARWRPAWQPRPQPTLLAAHARTSFSLAARFLPQPSRTAATDLYAFFRTLDDLVDDSPPGADASEAAIELTAWRVWLEAGMTGSGPRVELADRLRAVVRDYGIPTETLVHLLDGLEFDLAHARIVTDEDLQRYCYQMASTVGCAMAHVLGATTPEAVQAAGRLGAAMQLTNILRDIGEDLERGRLYLPVETLERFGLSDEVLIDLRRQAGPTDARVRAIMQMYVAQADDLYREGIAGIRLLSRDARYPILLAARLYRRLLRIIERNDYDTLRRRCATSRRDKAAEVVLCGWLVARGCRDDSGPLPGSASWGEEP